MQYTKDELKWFGRCQYAAGFIVGCLVGLAAGVGVALGILGGD